MGKGESLSSKPDLLSRNIYSLDFSSTFNQNTDTGYLPDQCGLIRMPLIP
jgi:hypothetical protein